MKPERYEQIAAVFAEVRVLTGPERDRVLALRCGQDAELRREVEAYLADDEKAGVTLDNPLVDANAVFDTTQPMSALTGERPGDFIGPYKLLEIIGEGGFGTVWLAERREPMVQRVALKVIKPGMDSKAVIARFEQERQALAVMDHPSVAKVFDGGVTPAGRPYFVMEYVAGEAITTYCDRHSVSITDRLKLFMLACEGVQHAHMKGIIHRDVKPSNILVTVKDGQPIVKVIDFGVAKAISRTLTEQTIFTESGQMIGTPEYMSPEQAEMGALDIDTRTDVYSLGVLLYQLVSGFLPFDAGTLRAAGYDEIRRIIREQEPERPSTKLSSANAAIGAQIAKQRQLESDRLTSELRRELDWIPLKAIRKDRAGRYESPSDLARDVRRYIDGDVLNAGPESALYHLRKFAHRHRIPVLTVTAVIVALGSGLAIAVSQRIEAVAQRTAAVEAATAARRAEAAAQARAEELKQVSEFQESMLGQIDPTMAGIRLTKDVLAKLNAAIIKSGVPDTERNEQIGAFRLHWNRVNATDVAIGLIDETILTPATLAVQEQFQKQPQVAAKLQQVLADLYYTLGLYDKASPLQTAALDTFRRVLGEGHQETLTSMDNTGLLLMEQGKMQEAEDCFRRALSLCSNSLGTDHPSTLTALNDLGLVLNKQGKYAEAEQYYNEALKGRGRVLGADHEYTIRTLNNLGTLLQQLGRHVEAEACLRDALEKRSRALGAEHPHTLQSMSNLASLFRAQGKYVEAEQLAREALEKKRRVLGEEHPETIIGMNTLSLCLQSLGKTAEAEPYTREALEKSLRLFGDEHPDTLICINNMGFLLSNQRRYEEAEPYYRQALQKRIQVLGDESPDTLYSIHNLGTLLLKMRKFAEAEPYIREAVDKRRKVLGEVHPATIDSIRALGSLLKAQGQLAEVEELYSSTADKREREFGSTDKWVISILRDLAVVCETQKIYDRSERAWRRVLDAQERTLVPESWEIANTKLRLGGALVGQGRFADAEQFLLVGFSGLATAKDLPSTPPGRLAKACNQVVELYDAWGKAEPGRGYDTKAAEWKAKLEELQREVPSSSEAK